MRCPRCHAPNDDDCRFCEECGARLEVACPGCGQPAGVGKKFCRSCGVALTVASAAPPQSYTPKHLAEKILSSRDALEGERKQVTVLFADLKGSMELLVDRDPEEVRTLLDPVLERMMEAVHRYEGTVNQVMGDGIMALFGAPLAHEDHAVRACFAALDMQESVSRHGDALQRAYAIPLQIRVGLNSGEVLVRSIGSDLHTDYVAVGQTTHLAARMEQMAKPGSVLITADTFRLAEAWVQVRRLGSVPIKGLETPVEVYELAGAQPVRLRLQGAAVRGLSPFVGRDAEVEQLQRALDQARAGHGQVVAVVGEAGTGKTRLVFEFIRSPRADGWRVLESSGVSFGQTIPSLPVVDLLKDYFRIHDRDTPQSVREKVTEKVHALDERLSDVIPPLLGFLQALPEEDPFRSLGASQRRGRTLQALKRMIVRESQCQPLILVFESLHWIDGETQAFLDGLIESLPTARVLLLVSYRPTYQHAWGVKTYYTQLPIDPLPPESATALLQALLGNDPSLPPLKLLLVERTEGNPFFLEESIQRLVENQALTGQRGAYRLAKPLQTVLVPATVQAVLAARIDRLPPQEKQLIQAASVIGKDVSVALLEAIGDLSHEDVHRGLAHLQAAEFLYEVSLFPDLEYTFKHALTHEVAYGSLVQPRRRAYHTRIVEAIERLYSDRLPEYVERLAHHALLGEMWGKAVTYLRQAGNRAAARAANREAVLYLQSAIEALKHWPEDREAIQQAIDLRFDLWPLLLQLGHVRELLALSHETEQMAQHLGDKPRLGRVYSDLTNYHYLKGEPDRAIEYGERCLEIGAASGDLALQALARRYMGHSYHAQGRYRLAETVLQQNIEMLGALPGTDLLAQANISYVASCGWLAFTLAELGEFDRAQTYLDYAQKVAEASRHPYVEAIAWTLLGLVQSRRGQPDAAAGPLERSLEVCRNKQLAVWQPIPASLLGLALTGLGRTDEGLSLLEEGVKLSEELGIRAYLALWTTQCAEGLLIAGETERAHTVATHGLELALAHKERGHEAWALRLLGQVTAQRGLPARRSAEDYYRRAIALAHELEMRPLLARGHLGLGELYRRAGERGAAEDHLLQAASLFCEMDMRQWMTHSATELVELGRMVIVARHSHHFYDCLTRALPDGGKEFIVLDRRQGQRRQFIESLGRDRRQGDRRHHPAVDERLLARELAIVPAP
jgi:class 3 adenylate cyclase/tetratricopeptide (TPR) repeat protein